jgi:protoheme IX farnesyltransferase
VSSEPPYPAPSTIKLKFIDTKVIDKYYFLTKPGIVYGNAMTAAAGFLLASNGHVNFWDLLILLLGTSLIIASACVFNNYIDRGIDAKMVRTKKRATASGKISALAVNLYGAVLGILGFAFLTQTNLITFVIGLTAFISYVILYGYAKRKTMHGTLIGTIPGSAPLIAGYTAVTNSLDLAVLLLFLIMFTWQMAHFYSIAIFRLKDYQNAGIPVMPAARGIRFTKLQIIAYIFVFIIAVIDLSFFGYTGLSFLFVISGLGIYWLFKAIDGFKVRSDTKWARGMFGFSLIVLLALSVMISLNSFLP